MLVCISDVGELSLMPYARRHFKHALYYDIMIYPCINPAHSYVDRQITATWMTTKSIRTYWHSCNKRLSLWYKHVLWFINKRIKHVIILIPVKYEQFIFSVVYKQKDELCDITLCDLWIKRYSEIHDTIHSVVIYEQNNKL